MWVLPNPSKEARNLAKHGWSFGRVVEIFGKPVLQAFDDRPFGYEHEGRVQITGMIGMRVVVLVFEPVEVDDGDLAVRPISLRDANRAEEQDYWEVYA